MVKTIDPVENVLSALESRILDELWELNDARVRDIYAKIKRKHKCAQTSVAVTLDRLHEKKLVDRKITTGRGGLSYIYFPRVSKEEFRKSVVQEAVDNLIKRFGDSAVSYFNEKYRK